MSDNVLGSLANAFLAASDEMRRRPDPAATLFNANGHPVPLSEEAAEAAYVARMSRAITADVLKAIGNVYLGQAVSE